MKEVFKFIAFLIYTLSIFIIDDYRYLFFVTIINLLLMIACKTSLKKSMLSLTKIIIVIFITALFNIFLADLRTAILVITRLILVYNVTYTFSTIYSYTELANTISILLYPTKYIGINSKNIGLLICISVAFLPILKSEIEDIKNILIVKGINLRGLGILKNSDLILKPFLISIIQRVNELEISLKSKAYQE